jgi:hypothetical protein
MTGAVPAGGVTAGEAWHDYLDPGERLLWTGAPAQGLRFTRAGAVGSLGGLLVLAFALFWTAGAGWGLWTGMWREAEGLLRWFLILFPLFGVPFVALGLYSVAGHWFTDAARRARTRYALTDRRALIAERGVARVLTSWPIRPDTVVDYTPGPEATILFATEVTRDSDGDRYTERKGFGRIADGDTVYRLIRQIQTGGIP